MKKRVVEAVHEDDLEIFLENLGILNGLKSGKYHCYHCENLLNFDNLIAVYPIGDEIRFTCSKSNCFNLMNEDLALS